MTLARYESRAEDWTKAAETLAPALKLVRRDGTAAEQVRLFLLAADVERRAGHAAPSAKLLDEADAVALLSDHPELIQAVADARRRSR